MLAEDERLAHRARTDGGVGVGSCAGGPVIEWQLAVIGMTVSWIPSCLNLALSAGIAPAT